MLSNSISNTESEVKRKLPRVTKVSSKWCQNSNLVFSDPLGLSISHYTPNYQVHKQNFDLKIKLSHNKLVLVYKTKHAGIEQRLKHCFKIKRLPLALRMSIKRTSQVVTGFWCEKQPLDLKKPA